MGRPKKVEAGTTVAEVKEHKVEELGGGTTEVIKVQTKEQTERKNEPVIEKAKNSEKDTAPQIILSWVGPDGVRRTRTYGCAELRINEDKVETFQKSGIKTVMNISIEAQVIEKGL